MTGSQKRQRKAKHEHSPNKVFNISLTKNEIDHMIGWYDELRPQILRISDEDEGEGAERNKKILDGILEKLNKTDNPN